MTSWGLKSSLQPHWTEFSWLSSIRTWHLSTGYKKTHARLPTHQFSSFCATEPWGSLIGAIQGPMAQHNLALCIRMGLPVFQELWSKATPTCLTSNLYPARSLDALSDLAMSPSCHHLGFEDDNIWLGSNSGSATYWLHDLEQIAFTHWALVSPRATKALLTEGVVKIKWDATCKATAYLTKFRLCKGLSVVHLKDGIYNVNSFCFPIASGGNESAVTCSTSGNV